MRVSARWNQKIFVGDNKMNTSNWAGKKMFAGCLISAGMIGLCGQRAAAFEPPIGAFGALLDSDASRVSFQGQLSDNGGLPLPGDSVELAFAVYEVGGLVPVGSIPSAKYPMIDGLVHAQLPMAPEWFDGTGRELGVSVNGGPEMSPRLPLSAVPYAFRVHRVASAELDDDIELGDVDSAGALSLFGNFGAPTVQLFGPSGVARSTNSVEVRTTLPDGSRRASMHKAATGGEFQTWDNTNHLTTWIGTKSPGGGEIIGNVPFGGFGRFQTSSDVTGVLCDGSYAFNAGAVLVQKDIQGSALTMVEIIGDQGDSAPVLNMFESGHLRVRLDARGSGGGAGINLFNSNNAETVHIDSDVNDAAEILLADRNANWTLGLDGDDGNGARISMGVRSALTLLLDANDGDEMGRITFFGTGTDPNGGPGAPVMILNGHDGNGSQIELINNGVDTVRIMADGGDNSGRIDVRSAANQTNVLIDGCGGDDSGNCGGGILLYDGNGNVTVEIDANEGGDALIRVGNGSSSSGGLVLYRDGQANSTIHLNGDTGNARLGLDGAESGELFLYSDVGGGSTIHLNGDTGNARFGNSGVESGEIFLYSDTGGGATIRLNGDTGNTRTRTLTITGGADLAEPFDVTAGIVADVEPGMVVSIDPNHPGQLKVCDKPYDRTVAGIISGAGGVNPGMVMGQDGSIAHGRHPVALTGRVYVHADATSAPIAVGDLLTTSSTPGHAAKVEDYGKAQGAVIGKAMTPLAKGQGLVLVLVSLQ